MSTPSKESASTAFTVQSRFMQRRTVPAERDPELGRLAAFAGVARYPVRVKCASLSWHAMKSALHAEP